MIPDVKFENGCYETYYGIVKMPHYAGIKGELHQVTSDWCVGGVLENGDVFEISVSSGFRFDGCSIPRFLWRLCGTPFEVPRVAAALAHDLRQAGVALPGEILTAEEMVEAVCRLNWRT